jgi:beta-hydroxylase
MGTLPRTLVKWEIVSGYLWGHYILIFDETYLHYVRNDTDSDRLILMCDVKRPVNGIGAVFNLFYQGVTHASVVPNTPEDYRGLINRIFGGLSPLLARTKTLKSTYRPLYLIIKWSVNIGLLLLLLALAGGVSMLLGRLL